MRPSDSKGLSLFSRMLIAFLTVVILVSGALTWAFYVFSMRSIEQRTAESILQQFKAVEYHFALESREDMVKDLRLLASNPVLDDFIMSSVAEREIGARAVERLFLGAMKYHKSYKGVYFVDVLGMEQVRVDRSGRVRNYRNMSASRLFARIKAGAPGGVEFVGPWKDSAGRVVASIGIHKVDQDIGKFGGALIIDWGLGSFIAYLDGIRVFNENLIWLFSRDGTLLKQPRGAAEILDPRPYLSTDVQSAPRLGLVKEGMVVYQDLFVLPGKPVMRLAIGVPSSLLLRDVRATLKFISLVFLLALLSTSIIALYLSRYLSRPITVLADAASRLAKGDSTQVAVSASGEVRLLVDSFNKMAGDLKKTTVSKTTLQKILDSMPYGIIIIDKNKKIQSANQAALTLMEYETAHQVAGMTCVDTFCLDEKDKCPILDLKQDLDRSERILVTRDGKHVPILKSVIPLELDGQDVLLEAIVDITERKRAEEDLKKSEEKATQLVHENATMAEIGRIISSTLNIKEVYDHFAEEVCKLILFDRIVINILNQENTVTTAYISGAGIERRHVGDTVSLLGTATGECVRIRSSMLIQPEDIDECIARFPALLPTFQAGLRSMIFTPLISKGQAIGVLSLRARKPNAYTEEHLKLAERVGNQIASAIANSQLFTELKHTEGIVRKSKEFAETVLNSMNDAISIIDVHNFKIIDANQVFLDKAGMKKDELIGKACYAITHHRSDPCTPPDDICPLLDTLKTGRPSIAEHIHYIKDGERIHAEVVTSPIIDENGEISQAVHVARDITERKRAEEDLKKFAANLEQIAVNLEQSNRELLDFAYIASHDLQEPLRKITAFGDRLKVKFGDKLGEQGRDYLERMRNAAVRMQTLINGLLMYSSVSTKAQPFERVDLVVVASEVLSDLDVRIKQVQGRVELGDLPTVQADPLQMRQLFQNLIENALKFHAQGKALFIKVTSQRIAEKHQGPDGNGRPGESWQITVQDNGIGFDEKHVDRIFEVFRRLHGRSEYEGSGIGLTLCRKIVQRHGGVITAKSAPGTGAAFIVTLPISNNTQEKT